MRRIFVDGESGPFRRQFEQNSAGLGEVNRFKPEPIDDWGRPRTAFTDSSPDFVLMFLVIHSPGEVVNAACSPGPATGHGTLIKIDVSARFSAGDTITMPAVLRAEMHESHCIRQERSCANQIAFNHSRAFEAADL